MYAIYIQSVRLVMQPVTRGNLIPYKVGAFKLIKKQKDLLFMHMYCTCA